MESCQQFRRRVSGCFPQKVKRRSQQISLPLQMNIYHQTSLRLLKQLLSTRLPRSSANCYTSLITFDCVQVGNEEMMGCRDWLVLMRCESKRMYDGGVSISQVCGRLQMVCRADRVYSTTWVVKAYSESRALKDFRIYWATSITQIYKKKSSKIMMELTLQCSLEKCDHLDLNSLGCSLLLLINLRSKSIL